MVSILWITFCIPAVVVVLFSSINSELTRGPLDVYGVTGSTVTLYCSTNLSVPVMWDFRRVGAQPKEPWDLIYFGNPTSKIAEKYRNKNKYAVTVDSTGNEYNLMIYNLQTDDAGTYRCIDDYGEGGHKHDAGLLGFQYTSEVLAIEGNLTCFQSINDVQINLTSFESKREDKVNLGCCITYVGNMHVYPKLLWSVFRLEAGIENFMYHPQPKTTEMRSDVYRNLTSEIEINPAMTNHVLIKCNLTESANQILASSGTSNSVSLQVAWNFNVTDIKVKGKEVSGSQDEEVFESPNDFSETVLVAIGTILGILVGALIGVFMNSAYLLKKLGYRISARNLIRFYRRVKFDSLTNDLKKYESELQVGLMITTDKTHFTEKKDFIGENKEFLNPSTLLQMVANMNWVTGLSIIDDLMFVVRNKQSGVKMYDAKTFKPLTDIDIPNMKKPRGIVACPKNKALYISDDGLQCIHIVSLDGKSVKSVKVPYHSPQGLSMTVEGNLLLAVWKKPCRILEYTTEGDLIRNIELESIEAVFQAVQQSNDQYVICYGTLFSNFHGICVVNSEGEVIRSYLGEVGQIIGTLYFPCSLARDCKKDILFVADCGHHRVLKFSSDLTSLGIVKLNKELKFPARVYFDTVGDRLIIGDANGELITVTSTD